MDKDADYRVLEFGTLTDTTKLIRIARREAIFLLAMVFVGVLLMPISIYLVGTEVFGEYAGAGFGEFYRDIHGRLRDGQLVIVFLLMSPYLVIQVLRLSLYGFRRLSPSSSKQADADQAAAGNA